MYLDVNPQIREPKVAFGKFKCKRSTPLKVGMKCYGVADVDCALFDVHCIDTWIHKKNKKHQTNKQTKTNTKTKIKNKTIQTTKTTQHKTNQNKNETNNKKTKTNKQIKHRFTEKNCCLLWPKTQMTWYTY